MSYHIPSPPPNATAVTVAAVNGVFTNRDYDCQTEWEAWVVIYGLELKTDEVRRGIFCDRLEGVAAHNLNFEANEETYWMGVNEFSALTYTEFEERYLQYEYVETEEASPEELLLTNTSSFFFPAAVDEEKEDESLPNAVDHRGKLPAIKRQQCGDCWAFSAAASLDFLGGRHSEQQFVDCTKASSCKGGSYSKAFNIAKSTGACSSSSYPYKGRDGKCKTSCSPITKISGYKTLSSNIKRAASGHVLSIALGANNNFQNYAGGMYTGGCCSMNHAVNIVGYDSSTWLIRNSWGTSWGDRGYMHLKKGNCKLSHIQFPNN